MIRPYTLPMNSQKDPWGFNYTPRASYDPRQRALALAMTAAMNPDYA